mmetsp:Transcript_117013/g.331142  ORF Transcript_117013/g.331142 Transcript_117013/m.331142 type:complete len:219 (+) Transcript_117013:559-1215(+)
MWHSRTSSSVACCPSGSGRRWSTTWSATSFTKLHGSASNNSLASLSSLHVEWLPPLRWHSTTPSSFAQSACFSAKGQAQAVLWHTLSWPHFAWHATASPSCRSSFRDVGLDIGHLKWHAKSPWPQASWHSLAVARVELNEPHCAEMRAHGHVYCGQCATQLASSPHLARHALTSCHVAAGGRYFSKMPSTSSCRPPGAACAEAKAAAAKRTAALIATR